jgi:hypothetical protein
VIKSHAFYPGGLNWISLGAGLFSMVTII